jgi:hypothetical protein
MTTARGEDVELLDPGDLVELKEALLGKLAQLTRWLITVGMFGAFSAGFWAAGIRNELNDHATAIASLTVNGSQPVAQIRQDLAVTRAQMSSLSEQIVELKRALERRSP